MEMKNNSDLIRVAFLCNWGERSDELLKRYSNQTPNKQGKWKNIIGVSDVDKADYYIVLDGYREQLCQNKTIFLRREPKFIRTYHHGYKYAIELEDTSCGITWWINRSYDELKNMPYPTKTNKVSCIVSSKHTHRENYVKRLISYDSPIKLYGRGHNPFQYGKSYKGALDYDGNCKLRGLMDYEYSIVLENSQQKNYFTEKLADAYLSWTVPIYWGCPNIDDFFPDKSYHLIDLNHKNPIEEVNEIINKPIDVEVLREARNLILDKYNIWEVVFQKIQDVQK